MPSSSIFELGNTHPAKAGTILEPPEPLVFCVLFLFEYDRWSLERSVTRRDLQEVRKLKAHSRYFLTNGCWKITGRYEDVKLTFVHSLQSVCRASIAKSGHISHISG